MIYRLLLILFVIFMSSPAHADDSFQIGTGKDFLQNCETLIETGKANNIQAAMQGSFCMGYVNGLAQVYCDKSYDNVSIQDIGVNYIAYLKLHPKDQNLENSTLFKRMIGKNGP